MTDQTQSMSVDENTYCEVHPDRETGLRCNKCDRYMCAECAVQTPVGYRCRGCVRTVEDKFYNAEQQDYLIVFAVCAGLGAIAGGIVSAIGFLFLALILAFPIGGAISEAAMRAVRRRKGRRNGEFGAAGLAVGAFIGAVIQTVLDYNNTWGEVIQMFRDFGVQLPSEVPSMVEFIVENTLTDIGLLLFVGLAAMAVYSRYRM